LNITIESIIKSIINSNIKTLAINIDLHNFYKFTDNIIQSKIKNIHLNFKNEIMNHCSLNFTVNKSCPNYAQEIINRNKEYISTILLCMNKKIIPRYVFKNLILKHLFVI